MTTFLLTLGLVGIFFVFMSVRLILLKNGEFKGTCASQSPFLNKEGVRCGYCGKDMKAGESCGNPDNEVDKVMAKFK
ncbi:MAG: hypothetical protein COW03_04930 [Cytophagales bacterium CG12_big_fil_rev_8_21_14_0_65_40_12]|nr:MAG: hypothetical protein COW03_04930 [Cytophagales bacterium CG12_big_fil_rev_8_21_14_0_65_40_12]PIW05084.1 MAG: hypothetical protein COW40_06320 [Cytophagales bacterium CG17_big_fil_post_rev_8_21_14_2_50_40_13]